MTIGGHKISTLIDTGASKSIICSEHCKTDHLNPLPSYYHMKTANGEQIKPLGEASLDVEVNGYVISHTFVVVQHLLFPCIMGRDLLIRLKARISFAKRPTVSVKTPDGNNYYQLPLCSETKTCKLDETSGCNAVADPFSGKIALPRHGDELIEDVADQVRASLSPLQQQVVDDLQTQFPTVFEQNIGRTTLLENEINTSTNDPIYVKQYRLPHQAIAPLHELTDKLLAQDLIQPSKSPWHSPIRLVDKPDGSIRMCLDLRKLNKLVPMDRYPMPRIDDLVESIGPNAHVFSKLDLACAFHQIPLAKSSRCKTAFSIPGNGLFEFKVLPFGLNCASATFQRLMNEVLKGLPFVRTYQDDVFVFSSSEEEHADHLRQVFARFCAAGLTVRLTKCSFFRPSVQWLGITIDANGLRPGHEKTSCIDQYPVPRSCDDIRRSLGLTGYFRRFIRNYSDLAYPLTQLLRKDMQFRWTIEEHTVFERLKHLIVSSPVLVFPNFQQEFVIECDASTTGLGAVLLQQGKPVCFASRTLRDAEKNYSVIELESLAIVWAIKYFHSYLWHCEFKVITDHNPLRWLTSIKNPQGRLSRWLAFLQQYKFDIAYRPGAQNQCADALSRIECCGIVDNKNELKRLQRDDPELTKIYTDLRDSATRTHKGYFSKGGILHHRSVSKPDGQILQQIVLPSSLRMAALRHCHDESGHFGVEKSRDRLLREYFWPGLDHDLQHYIKSCARGQATKKNTQPHEEPLRPLACHLQPFDLVAMDLLKLPTDSDGYQYAAVFCDYASRFPVALPVKDKSTATVGQAFVYFGMCHRFPKRLITDQGTEFTSAHFLEFCKMHGISKE